MTDWYQDVLDFHSKFGCAVGEKPTDISYDQWQLRRDLMREELAETEQALVQDDLPGIADGVADLIYVAIGTAITCGIDLRPVWELVHRANMAKEGGATRADGKILKPEGWQPPDIEGEIERQKVAVE